MYRGSTPTVILNITPSVKSELDLSLIDICHVTLESQSGSTSITYEDVEIDIENKQIKFQMSQEDTLKFDVGKIKIQIRVKLKNGAVIPSNIVITDMNEILEEVIL